MPNGCLRLSPVWAPLIVASSLLGCTAESQPGDPKSSSGPHASGSGPTDPAALPGSAALPLPPSAGLRRLTRAEFRSSLRELLGVEPALEVEPDTRLDGFESVGAARVALSPLGVELYQRAIYEALDRVWADAALHARLVGCDPASAGCASTVVTNFGRRAWRRPLTAGEIARYVEVASSTGALLGDAAAGLLQSLAGLLQSPSFLYRVELGEPDPTQSGRLRYTSHELATRLSYLLTSAPPDDTLSTAADAGELYAVEGIRAQAERLLADPRGHQAIRGFARELLNLPAVDSAPKDPQLYPEFTPALRASLREEAERMWETTAFTPGRSLLDVLTTRETFVDDGLADLYGVPRSGQAGMVAVTLPDSGQRAGLLGTGAFLAVRAKTNETTPTLRGRFVREVLMCQTVPPPPPNVNTTLPVAPSGTLTRRQQLEQHRGAPACAGCHALMDPIGLAFENFDAIGRYRDLDRGLPIDASGDLDGAAFSGPRELGQRLRESPQLRPCLMRGFYRYMLGQSEESGGEAWIEELTRRFDASGERFVDFALSLVTADLFRFAAAPAAPEVAP